MQKVDLIEELSMFELDEVSGAAGEGFHATTSGDCNASGRSCWAILEDLIKDALN